MVELAAWAAWRWAGRRRSLLVTASPLVAVRQLPPERAHLPPERAHLSPERAHLPPDGHTSLPARRRCPPAHRAGPSRRRRRSPSGARSRPASSCRTLGKRAPTSSGCRPCTAPPPWWRRPPSGARSWSWPRPPGGPRPAARPCAAGGPPSPCCRPIGRRPGPVPASSSAPARPPGPVPRDGLDRRPRCPRRRPGARTGAHLGRPRRGGRTRPARRRALPMGHAVPDPRAAGRGGRGPRGQPGYRTGRLARLHVVDQRRSDPRAGLYSEELVGLLRDPGQRVVCVLNRKGRALLLDCAACGEVATCEHCAGAVRLVGDDLICRGCRRSRPVVCASCGSDSLRLLRVGVTRAREQLEALAGRPVGEVAAATAGTGTCPAPTCWWAPRPSCSGRASCASRGPLGAVAFLDFDQELLAPRYRAAEEALALLARASRLVGGRRRRAGAGPDARSPATRPSRPPAWLAPNDWPRPRNPSAEPCGCPLSPPWPSSAVPGPASSPPAWSDCGPAPWRSTRSATAAGPCGRPITPPWPTPWAPSTGRASASGSRWGRSASEVPLRGAVGPPSGRGCRRPRPRGGWRTPGGSRRQ